MLTFTKYLTLKFSLRGWEDTTAGKSFAFHVVDLGLTPKHHIVPKHYQKLPSVEPRLSTDFRWVWPLPTHQKKMRRKEKSQERKLILLTLE